MSLRGLTADRALELPPLYDVVPLRELGDAFAHACAIADDRGAGTLVWVRRFDLAEFAVVLEPEVSLTEARHAFYVGMNALGDALCTHAPPETPIGFDWPDAIRVDGVLVGGGRLGCPSGVAEGAVPPWLVFSAMVRTAAMGGGEPGARPLLGALDETGFEDVDAGEIVASFARHLMAGFHDWSETGSAGVAKRWLDRLVREPGRSVRLADNGDLLVFRGADREPSQRRNLAGALAAPSWLDPGTGMPWL